MKTRRHLLVAAAIAATQILSLVVATDVLGADVGDYATRSSSIEAVGEEPDLDTPARGDEGEGEAALDLSTLDTLRIGRDDGGSIDTSSATTDPDPTAVDQASSSTSAAPTPEAATSTSAAPTPEAATSTSAPGSTGTPVPPTSGAELTESDPAPVVDRSARSEAGGSSTVVPVSSSVAPSSSPSPSSSPDPATPTSAAGVTTTAAAPPSVTTTTWLPVTTRNAITTWATDAITSVTNPDRTTTTRASTTTASASTTTTATSTTAASTPQAPTTAAPATSGGPNGGLEAIRNRNPLFDRYAGVPSDQLDLALLTEAANRRDNGSVGDGQFRAACLYSHFAYDDPIVFPGQPGRSHLHMFFGNTRTNANTTFDSLVNSGGGSCNGFELNRSAYWVPALLDGRGNAVVPQSIILYYKSKQPGDVQRMPQGLKMISGNTTAETFTASQYLFWSCGPSGRAYNVSNRIPDCGGDTINATIAFPQCWDGRNLDSADHRSHMALVNPQHDCPSSHPVRLPQITILLYFPGQPSVRGWHLSSDRSGGFNTGPGATLHADWWGGWNDETMDLWTQGCMRRARNCSFGQTGTDRVLARLNPLQKYDGDTFLPLP